jgi:hypothetical protein
MGSYTRAARSKSAPEAVWKLRNSHEKATTQNNGVFFYDFSWPMFGFRRPQAVFFRPTFSIASIVSRRFR